MTYFNIKLGSTVEVIRLIADLMWKQNNKENEKLDWGKWKKTQIKYAKIGNISRINPN